MNRRALALIILALILTACGSAVRPAPLARHTAYVLSGIAEAPQGQSLTLIDPDIGAALRTVPLPHSRVRHLNADPQGRIWIGFSGTQTTIDNLIQVYSPRGDRLHELRPCQDPAAGISFAAGRAFIACAQNGFSGQVAVLDLVTMKVERTIDLKPADDALMLITSAADEYAVVVIGVAVSPDRRSSNVITIIDPRTLEVRAQLNAGADTDIWRVLPHGGRFYMLNAGSGRQPRDQANDLLILDATAAPKLTPLALAHAPVWGAINGEALYAYHNPAWSQGESDGTRTLSRFDLKTGAVRVWPLPQNWHANDLAVLDGQILLSHHAGKNATADGLYRFDPADGGLERIFDITNANRMLLPATFRATPDVAFR